MKRWKFSHIAVWALTIAILILPAGDLFEVHAQVGQVPFRLERWIYSRDGQLALKEIVYGNGTGSIGFIRSSRVKPDRYVVREVEQTDGLVATMVDDLRIVFNVVRPLDLAAWRLRAAESGCVQHSGETSEGVEMIEGISTMKIAVGNPSGHRTTEWRAPALACTVLRRLVEATGPGGVTTSSMEFKLISLSLERQDSGLFGIPSDYVEVLPSNLYQRLATLSGLETPPESRAAFARRYQELDASYSKKPHIVR